MIVLAWILLLAAGPYPVPFVDLQECKTVAAKYPGAECITAKVFVAKADPAATLPRDNKVEQK